MTREEIDQALADLVQGGTQDLGGGVKSITGLAILAQLVADQERRLRVLEDANAPKVVPHV